MIVWLFCNNVVGVRKVILGAYDYFPSLHLQGRWTLLLVGQIYQISLGYIILSDFDKIAWSIIL